MSYNGNRQMVSRWAPSRPRTGRPGGSLARLISSEDGDNDGAPIGAYRETEVRSPNGPRLSEELSLLADRLADRELAQLERLGRFLRPEVF